MTDTEFRPNWVSPPGDTILDAIEELGLSQKDLAERLGVTRKHVNDLVKGRANITADMAVMLEKVLGEPAEFWMKRDSEYRIALARQEELEQAKEHADWLKLIPYAEMARLGWVRKATHKGEKVIEALRFFGVGSIDAWEDYVAGLCLAYRDSGRFERKHGAVAAWVRKAEIDASGRRVEAFNRALLKASLPELRALTLETRAKVFVPRLTDLCASFGVIVVFVPPPKGCPASAATWGLTPTRAVMGLTLRYKSNDQLWFSVFHELGHLLKHPKRLRFIAGIDGVDPELDEEANQFAAETLIPRNSGYEDLCRKGPNASNIVAFANRLGIAPGIVVGRMQREGVLPWKSMLNKLKVRYDWTEE